MIKNKITIFLLCLSLASSWSVLAWFCDKTSSESAPAKAPICQNWPQFIERYLSDASNLISSASPWKKGTKVKDLWHEALNTSVWAYEISKSFANAWLWNFHQNLTIISQDSHIIRDWSKIVNYKKYISKLYMKIAKEWDLIQDITNKNEILQKIKNWSMFLLNPDWKINSYQDLFEYVWINHVLLEKIFHEKIESWAVKIEEMIAKESKKIGYSIELEKAKHFLEAIDNTYYKEWKKLECSKSRDNFIRHMNNIVCNIWDKDSKEAVERFNCNYQRLKSVLWLWWSEGNCWSEELKEWVPMNERIMFNWWWEIAEIMTEMWKIIKEDIPWATKDAMNAMFPPRKDCRVDDCGKETYDSNNIASSKYKSQMWVVTEQIIQDNNEVNSILSNVESSEFTHNTTIDFPKISEQIRRIRENVEKKEDSIFENTAQACENQSPYGKKCRP